MKLRVQEAGGGSSQLGVGEDETEELPEVCQYCILTKSLLNTPRPPSTYPLLLASGSRSAFTKQT